MSKKIFILLFVVMVTLFMGGDLLFAQAPRPTEYTLLEPLPFGQGGGTVEKITTAQYLPWLFRFIVAIAGVLAVIRLIWAGIQYMSTDAWSGKNEAKNTIWDAIMGLLLVFSAYIILYTIGGAKLTEFNLSITPLPSPTNTNVPGGGGSGTPGSGASNLTQQQVYDQLRAGRVDVIPLTLRLAGLQQKTIDEAVNLKRMCGCDVGITSATGGSHRTGEASHANGYKIDLRLNSNLNNYIERNYTRLPNLREGRDPMWRAPSGAIYTKESNHWDVVVPFP